FLHGVTHVVPMMIRAAERATALGFCRNADKSPHVESLHARHADFRPHSGKLFTAGQTRSPDSCFAPWGGRWRLAANTAAASSTKRGSTGSPETVAGLSRRSTGWPGR